MLGLQTVSTGYQKHGVVAGMFAAAAAAAAEMGVTIMTSSVQATSAGSFTWQHSCWSPELLVTEEVDELFQPTVCDTQDYC